MDYRVTWSPAALDDVGAIAEYINRIQNNEVLIIAVVHGRWLLEPLFGQISNR